MFRKNIKNNEYNFEKEVTDYLGLDCKRRQDVIEHLKEIHKNDRGYSEKNINTKLYKMINQGIVKKVKYPDFEKFGINDTDTHAIYLTVIDPTKTKDHMEKVIKKVLSEEPIIQRKALRELELYKEYYYLDRKQLGLVVTRFCKDIDKENTDDELIYFLLMLLERHILKNGIEPTDKTKTINLLKKLLNKYPLPVSTYPNLRTYIIYLLGHYGNEVVIKRLMEDARLIESHASIENVYKSEHTANLIYEHTEELYKLEEELELEGNSKASQFIFDIRVAALQILGLHENPYTKGKKEDENW